MRTSRNKQGSKEFYSYLLFFFKILCLKRITQISKHRFLSVLIKSQNISTSNTADPNGFMWNEKLNKKYIKKGGKKR